jgi:hypothetical protein
VTPLYDPHPPLVGAAGRHGTRAASRGLKQGTAATPAEAPAAEQGAGAAAAPAASEVTDGDIEAALTAANAEVEKQRTPGSEQLAQLLARNAAREVRAGGGAKGEGEEEIFLCNAPVCTPKLRFTATMGPGAVVSGMLPGRYIHPIGVPVPKGLRQDGGTCGSRCGAP